MYYKKLFCCIFFIISNYAYAQVEYPSKCPSIEFLKTGGLNKILKENNLSYTASNKNNYGSNHDWIFKIKLIYAHNEGQAMLAAFENLKSLRGTPKPIDAGYKTIWLCSYKINNNYIAEAITIVGMD